MKRMGQATHADDENQQLPPPPFSFSHTHGKRPRHDSKGMCVSTWYINGRRAVGVWQDAPAQASNPSLPHTQHHNARGHALLTCTPFGLWSLVVQWASRACHGTCVCELVLVRCAQLGVSDARVAQDGGGAKAESKRCVEHELSWRG